jgi:hypothetical protein
LAIAVIPLEPADHALDGNGRELVDAALERSPGGTSIGSASTRRS